MEGVPLVSRGKERKSPLGLTVGHKERITRPLLFSRRLQRNVDAPEEQLLIRWSHILVFNRGLRKGRESELKEHKSRGQGRVQGDLLMGQSTERPTCPQKPRVADHILKKESLDSGGKSLLQTLPTATLSTTTPPVPMTPLCYQESHPVTNPPGSPPLNQRLCWIFRRLPTVNGKRGKSFAVTRQLGHFPCLPSGSSTSPTPLCALTAQGSCYPRVPSSSPSLSSSYCSPRSVL